MKLLLTAAAAGVLAFSIAGQAAAAPVGHVGANYTWMDAETDFGDAEADAVQVEGAVAFDLGGLGGAVDAQIGDVNDDGEGTSSSLTAHLNTGDAKARFGGFAGYQDLGGFDGWGVGAEALVAVSPTVNLYGQAGYGWVDGVDDLDIWGLRGEARWFASDNFRVDGGLGFSNIDGGAADASVYNVGVGAEYQFAGTPFSVLAGYQHTWSDDLAGLEADSLTVGARFSFGGSLRDRENAGANLGSVNKLLAGGL